MTARARRAPSTPQGDDMADGPDYEQLVRDFCAAWAAADFDKVVSYFAEDGVYHNIPVDPLTGHEAIRGMIEAFTAGLKVVEFKILTMLSDGPTVITERVDVFEKPDGGTVELPVMGIFEWDGDKIASWREYFDLNQFMSQAMPAE
jgi:limonene-1,2-epoxide hydrolase